MQAIAFLLVVLAALIQAAAVPLNLLGALEDATPDSDDYNTGGKIRVNGVTVTIPKNLQVQFPAAWVPFKTVANGQFEGYEVSVTGNVVDGNAIAGIVTLAQFGLSMTTGVVTSLSFDGAIRLDTGVTLRINDPNGVYSAGTTQLKEFTADDENPSVSAYSGFPMCVPRSANDPKCPASNRPAGQRSFTAQDSTLMAPIQQGDYIECSGVRLGGEVFCYNLVVPNVQILTTGVPPYIRMEDGIIGVVDESNIGGVEFADTRFIGYTTDASKMITISRMTVDPCTGEVTETTVGTAQPRAGRNKWTWRPDASVKSDYTRDYLITAAGGTRKIYDGQIIAGQYVQPVGEWIFPESTSPGAIPPKADFSSFTWLAKGFGPDEDGNIWGPLSPWPDTQAPPAPPTCGPVSPPPDEEDPPPGNTGTPEVNAGTDAALRPGVRIQLKGVVSNAASFSNLQYSWAQTAGPTITLANPTTATASFVAPRVAALTSYTFELTVTAGTSTAKDSITVTNDPSKPDVVTVDSYTWDSRQGGTLFVTGHSNVVDGSARLSLILNNPNAGNPIAMTNSGDGKFTYTARSTKNPSGGVTIRSNLNGQATLTTRTAKLRRRYLPFEGQ